MPGLIPPSAIHMVKACDAISADETFDKFFVDVVLHHRRATEFSTQKPVFRPACHAASGQPGRDCLIDLPTLDGQVS